MPAPAVETAHFHLETRIPVASPEDTAASLVALLAGGDFAIADPAYLLDARGAPCGIVPLSRLLGAPPAARLATLALACPPAVRLGTDQEHVASHAIAHGVSAVPVVDRDGRWQGVVPPLALLEVLRHEHVEDLHRFAGIAHDAEVASRAIEEPPARRARHRLPWLLAGLGGSVLTALVMQRFEATLQANVAVAFFIPAIVYLADAVGTQSESIAVRGLSLSHKPLPALLGGELRTGALIGTVLSLLALLPIWLVLGDVRLAAAVAIALFASSCMATVIGFTLPWLLARTGADPAFGSGPLATILQDVLSLLIYFGVVVGLLG
ncbi:magnesium transporter [Quisquiliibacterium transsilvanicum]|jgi:magnesium transporter|uniref:Magnesium transporter n=1 Tax=Quisquiliibacterium transsilvanicum TaxID=1549638 RepID=A0A7W8HHC2_9BURK|nr:magnesium transporter [Quisquiliibacterium transsilvanicum]MBB5271260.1 magnesium transporter [Quisquiliibacterium transsilvanicum]